MHSYSKSPNISWCLSQSNPVHWAEWEGSDESILYIESTGQTVIISLLSLCLLETLHQKAQNLMELTNSLSELFDEDIKQIELRSAIQSSLEQLQQYNAIEPCNH